MILVQTKVISVPKVEAGQSSSCWLWLWCASLMDKSCILSPCFSTGVALGWNQLPPWRARPRTWDREYSVKVSPRCQYERVLPSLLEKKKWKKEITYWYRVKYNHLLRFPGQTQSFEKNSCTVVESALEPYLEMWLFVTKCVRVWRGLLVSSPVMRVSFPFADIPGRGLWPLSSFWRLGL